MASLSTNRKTMKKYASKLRRRIKDDGVLTVDQQAWLEAYTKRVSENMDRQRQPYPKAQETRALMEAAAARRRSKVGEKVETEDQAHRCGGCGVVHVGERPASWAGEGEQTRCEHCQALEEALPSLKDSPATAPPAETPAATAPTPAPTAVEAAPGTSLPAGSGPTTGGAGAAPSGGTSPAGDTAAPAAAAAATADGRRRQLTEEERQRRREQLARARAKAASLRTARTSGPGAASPAASGSDGTSPPPTPINGASTSRSSPPSGPTPSPSPEGPPPLGVKGHFKLDPADAATMLTDLMKALSREVAKDGLPTFPDWYWDKVYHPAAKVLAETYLPKTLNAKTTALPVVAVSSGYTAVALGIVKYRRYKKEKGVPAGAVGPASVPPGVARGPAAKPAGAPVTPSVVDSLLGGD